MSDVGGIFIDIFSRLNLASAAATVDELKSIMRRAGEDSSKAFTQGAAGIGSAFKEQFSQVTEIANAAYREMQVGLADLQRAEAQINLLRLQNFKSTSDEMVAAQKEYERAIMASQSRIAEAQRASDARIAALAPARSGGRHEEPEDRAAPPPARGGRGGPPLIPLPRGANAVGLGALIGGAAFVGEGVRTSAEIQNNLNSLAVLQRESANNIDKITQAVYAQAQQTGFRSTDISNLYKTVETAVNGRTGQPYRGQDAIDIVGNALKLARVSGGRLSPEESLQGLTTTMHDYRVGPEGSADVAGMLMATIGQMKGSPEEFFRSLHTVEPAAMITGIKPEEIFAALSQMSQTGQTSQQSAQNLSNILKSFSAPNSTTAKALGQLGLNPQNMSVELSQKGLAGTLNEVLQAIAAKAVGPNGSVVLGAMTQNELMGQQQQEVLAQMTPAAKAFIQSPDFQKNLLSGFQIRKALMKANAANVLSPSDEPLIEEYLKEQKALEGPSNVIKQNKPDVESLLAAFSQAFNTKDAARTALMLAGSPQAIGQYQNREQEIQQQGNPNAFNASFTQAMQPDIEKWHQLGQQAGTLAARFGHDLLPVVGDVINGFQSTMEFLDRNKVAMDALIGVVTTLAGAYGFVKVVNGIENLSGAITKTKAGMDKVGGILSDRLPTQVSAVGTSSQKLADAESAAATKVETAGTMVEESTAGGGRGGRGGFLGGRGRAAASMAGMGATMFLPDSGSGLPGGSTTAGVMNTAAGLSWMLGPEVGAPVTITIGTAELLASIVNMPGGINQRYRSGEEPYSVHDYYPPGTRDAGAAMQSAPPGQIAHPEDLGGLLGASAGGSTSSAPAGGAGSGLYAGILPGAARGGVIGYKRGGKVADPYSQPLLGQPDMGRDSLLGMLPDGMPIGLRGGEGILTPEATQALGGKSAIDALNKDPWSNPFKVATTFYGSFAKGVAKYSPWGKFLEASSKGLDALEQEHERSTQIHESGREGGRHRRGLPAEIQQMLASGMSQQDILKALGAIRGKRGGYMLPGGRHLSAEDRQMLGIPSAYHGSGGGAGAPRGGKAVASYIYNAALSHGYSPSDATAIVAYSIGESSLNPGISGGVQGDDEVIGLFQEKAGFARSGGVDPSQRGTVEGNVTAYLNNLDKHRGGGDIYNQLLNTSVGGPMYTGGRGYMDSLVAQARGLLGGDSSDPYWRKGHAKGGVVGYSDGGVVGFDLGGFVPMPTDPGATAAQAAPSITTNAQAAGIAPKDGAGPAPNIAPKDPDNRGSSPLQVHPIQPGQSRVPSAPAGPKTPDRQAPKAPEIKPSHTDVQHAPRAALTPQGTKPGNYASSSDDRNIRKNPSMQPNKDDAGKGFGIGGGLIGAAESAASMAAGAFSFGGGSMASQLAFSEINRAIGYGGQLVGIGIEGIMESFLPHDSALGDPSKNILGKMAMGIAGSHPSGANTAGRSAMQMKPKEDLDAGAQQAKQIMPMVHMDHPTIHNHTSDHQETGNAILKATQGLMVAGQG